MRGELILVASECGARVPTTVIVIRRTSQPLTDSPSVLSPGIYKWVGWRGAAEIDSYGAAALGLGD